MIRRAARLAPVCAALIGCAGDEAATAWSFDAAIAPHHARLDADGSGGIEAAEYLPLAPSGPAFEAADQDGSGALDPSELQALLLSQDPQRFDGTEVPGGFTEIVHPDEFHPDSFEQRTVREVLTILRDELAHLDPTLALPGDAEIAAAAMTGRLDSPESEAVLEPVVEGLRSRGAPLPAFLGRL